MIASGHNARDVWDYTPRQLKAFLFIAERRRQRERADDLSIGIMAARGDPKAVKKAIKDMTR